MIITLFLLIANIICLSIIILILFHALIQARFKIPILLEIFIGLIIIIFLLMDSIWARWFYEVKIFNQEQYFVYRSIFEVILGIIGFYIIIEISINDLKKQIIFKALILIIGTNFISILLLLGQIVHSMNQNTIGFLFLLNKDVPIGIQIFILCTKIFGLGGLILFLFQVCVLVVKSNLFSRWSKVFLICGILSLIDCLISIPIIDILFNLNIELVFIIWLITFLFIIIARLNRIDLKVIINIHDMIITHESGIRLFSLSDGKMETDLISSAMAGVTSIIQEISGSRRKVRVIDEQDVKFLFAFGKHCFITLIVEGESLILTKMLNKLLYKFESEYSTILENWSGGNLNIFNSAKKIVDSIFSQVEWKTQLRVD